MINKGNDDACSRKTIGLCVLISATVLAVPALGLGNDNNIGETSAARGADYDLSWHTIDGGGVMFSTGGDFELSGTIGQPDAGGPLLGPPGSGYELTGGFWFAQPPGDCVFDGVVNLLDFNQLVDCTTGPDATTVDACRCQDTDSDGDVDLHDFAGFQSGFSGS